MAHKGLAHSSKRSRGRDGWLTRLLAHSLENAQEIEIWAHRALGLLLTAQRALKGKRYWLTRPLNLNLNLNQTTAKYML